jgi:hypothetical protein
LLQKKTPLIARGVFLFGSVCLLLQKESIQAHKIGITSLRLSRLDSTGLIDTNAAGSECHLGIEYLF